MPSFLLAPNDDLVQIEHMDLIDSLSATMPSQLRIDSSTIPGQTLGVFSSSWIKQGTKMGPFTGRLVPKDEHFKRDSKYVWEVSTAFELKSSIASSSIFVVLKDD